MSTVKDATGTDSSIKPADIAREAVFVQSKVMPASTPIVTGTFEF